MVHVTKLFVVIDKLEHLELPVGEREFLQSTVVNHIHNFDTLISWSYLVRRRSCYIFSFRGKEDVVWRRIDMRSVESVAKPRQWQVQSDDGKYFAIFGEEREGVCCQRHCFSIAVGIFVGSAPEWFFCFNHLDKCRVLRVVMKSVCTQLYNVDFAVLLICIRFKESSFLWVEVRCKTYTTTHKHLINVKKSFRNVIHRVGIVYVTPDVPEVFVKCLFRLFQRIWEPWRLRPQLSESTVVQLVLKHITCIVILHCRDKDN